jgi:hypothetical protein
MIVINISDIIKGLRVQESVYDSEELSGIVEERVVATSLHYGNT